MNKVEDRVGVVVVLGTARGFVFKIATSQKKHALRCMCGCCVRIKFTKNLKHLKNVRAQSY